MDYITLAVCIVVSICASTATSKIYAHYAMNEMEKYATTVMEGTKDIISTAVSLLHKRQ